MSNVHNIMFFIQIIFFPEFSSFVCTSRIKVSRNPTQIFFVMMSSPRKDPLDPPYFSYLELFS